MTHGPGSTADEFQSDAEIIQEMTRFQHIDERGFNWGMTVKKKSERVLKLIEKGKLLKEERDRARKVTREIKGFGSINAKWMSNENGSESVHGSDMFRKCNSHYEVGREVDNGIKHQGNNGQYNHSQ